MDVKNKSLPSIGAAPSKFLYELLEPSVDLLNFDALARQTERKKMNILFSFNDTIGKYAPVTMISLYMNNKDYDIDIYILYNMLSSRIVEDIEKTAEGYGQKVYFINVHDPWVFDPFQRYAGSFECYFDLFPNQYLDQSLDRILYLDVDLFVNRDISELYFMDFDGAYLIGAADVSNVIKIKDGKPVTLDLAATGVGFNSGVMVMNLKKFREENVCVNDYVAVIDKLKDMSMPYFGDQGLINAFMLGKPVKYVPLVWNYLYIDDEVRNEQLRKYDLSEVAIFHCGGNEYKPWYFIMRDYDINMVEERGYLLKYHLSPIFVEINRLWGSTRSIHLTTRNYWRKHCRIVTY
jgi:lipopolysaccharide biosynthesis glycosyltransferase